MKILYQGHSHRFGVEQLLMTLMPDQTPEISEEIPTGDHLITTLTHEGDSVIGGCKLRYLGVEHTATHTQICPPDNPNPAEQFAIKSAMFACITAATGVKPPWGSMSGVRPVKVPTKWLLNGTSAQEITKTLIDRYHIDPVRAQFATTCAQRAVEVRSTTPEGGVSLYVGIPFCPSRCYYCSFISANVENAIKIVPDFLQALAREIKVTATSLCGRPVHTVYIGGGTPTVLSATELDQLLGLVREVFCLDNCIEFTVEAGRPDTLNPQKLAVLASHGVTRISLNPQTMDDNILQSLGRTHTAQEVVDWYHAVRRDTSLEVNMDLIAGLPNDSYQGFCQSLEKVIALNPEQITVHTLAVKKGANITTRNETNRLLPHDVVASMINHAWETLARAGYAPYYLYRQKYMSGGLENIGWCRDQHISHYNILMMEELSTVVSVGGGGMTKVIGEGRFSRIANPKYPHDYLRTHADILHKKEILFKE